MGEFYLSEWTFTMIEAVRRLFTFPPAAMRFENPEHDELLLKALLIANDILSFNAHRVYLCWRDGSENLWKHPQGFFHDLENLERSRAYSAQLTAQESESHQLAEQANRLCFAKLRLREGAEGYLAVARKLRPFSSLEQYHLEQVARLIRDALNAEIDLTVLDRLHLSFLHGRRLIEDLPSREIARAYAMKAAYVCHGLDLDRDDLTSSPAVRPTVKLINTNGMALKLVEQASTSPDEWTPEKQKQPYALPATLSAADASSIAARVFCERRTFWTNRYGRDGARIIRVFGDTQCHISAAICADVPLAENDPMSPPDWQCWGVLSVETAAPDSYRESHAAAMTLLAAHLARPLRRAIRREAARTEERVFTEALTTLRSLAGERHLGRGLIRELRRLGYARGMLSKVVPNSEDPGGSHVCGILSWGGARMRKVRKCTHRLFSECPGDCQVLAVKKGAPQLINDPQSDPSAHQTALEAGDLKPFGVFPLLDNHRRTCWTVHVERADHAPLGERDCRRIEELCRRVMKSREEERRTEYERSWFSEMVSSPFPSLRPMLCRFADFVCEYGMAERCRVFCINERGAQIPWHQAGKLQSPQFKQIELDNESDDGYVLHATKPVLFVRRGTRTDLYASDEFEVRCDQGDPHEEALLSHCRTQWVEAPVSRGGRVVAKLVVDHSETPDDAFSLGEMRLIGRFTRILSVAAEAMETRFDLACLGLNASLFWHYLWSRVDDLGNAPQDFTVDDYRARVNKVKKCLDPFRELFRKRREREARTHPKGAYITVGEELRWAKDLLESHVDGGVDLQFPREDSSRQIPRQDHPLLQILLVVLHNACEAIRLRREAEPAAPAKIDVRLNEAPEKNLVISVADTGAGVTPELGQSLREVFRSPAKFFAGHQASGLVYSALIAEVNGWRLNLSPDNERTIFEIVLPYDAEEAL